MKFIVDPVPRIEIWNPHFRVRVRDYPEPKKEIVVDSCSLKIDLPQNLTSMTLQFADEEE